MLSLLKAGTAYAEKIFSSLQSHPLGKLYQILVSGLHRLNVRPLKHGVGACKLRTLFILNSIGKNRGLYIHMKANPLFDGKGFAL